MSEPEVPRGYVVGIALITAGGVLFAINGYMPGMIVAAVILFGIGIYVSGGMS